jgi:PQQ-dependent dehydrogenase (methanol/ethanol family)
MKGKNLASYSIRLGMVVLFLGACALWLLPSRLFATTPKHLDWPNYGNDLHNTRFQDIDQINRKNVQNLRPAWVFHTGVLDPLAELQASPIVIAGRMFVTDGHDDVFALDAATGKQIWAYKPLSTGDMPPIEQMTVCCGRNNKGVAYSDGKVFYGRLDDVVVALNAKTGKVVWEKKLARFEDHFVINNAPQVANGLVIISLSGGEYEVRGQVFALRASDGEQMWHFMTTDPASYGAPASDQYKRGGAAVWNPPAIDEQLGLVYVITGNAAPDILGEDRPGDNLFATSIVALDLRTGEPRWHFQAVHHDIWDYDSAQPAVLFPIAKGGVVLPALGHCSKNGQYYILDRRNGTPIFPVTELPVPPGQAFQHAARTQPYSAVEPLTPLTFVRPNDTGFPARPQYTPPGEKDAQGNPIDFVMVPGDDGGCEWNPAAFSPRTNFIYYGTRYEPTTFRTFEGNRAPLPNGLHLGSTFTNRVPGSHPFGLFGATDATTGKIVWKIEVPIPAKSGVTVAGDLVFFGEGNGKFHAADAETGRILFTFDPRRSRIRNVGGAAASPSAYVVDGREFVAYAFGGNVPDRNNFANLDGQNPDSGKVGDAIIAFALPGKEGEDDAEQD